MGAVSIQQMAERISGLLTERLHIKGDDLADKLNRASRQLPRKVRVAGKALAEAQAQSHNPKLLLQIDEAAVAQNYDICLKYLSALNKGYKLRGVLLGLSTSILFSLVAVVVILLAVLVWRGFV